MSYHNISYLIIWYHMISYDIIWYHMISYDKIGYVMIRHDMLSWHMVHFFQILLFSKLFGHVGDMFGYHHWSFWGHQKFEKNWKFYFFLKLFIDLWAMIWHHHWIFLARKYIFLKISKNIFRNIFFLHIYFSFSGIFKDN